MHFKILKKDLKRKKTMNLILLIFILLATMFVAGSLNMAVTVMNGTNYFFEEAGIGDYLILTMRGSVDADRSNEEAIARFLQEDSYVDQYSQDEQLFLMKKDILKPDNEQVDSNKSILLSSYNIHQQYFFDSANQKITHMDNGTVYLPLSLMMENNLEAGDEITLHTENGFEKKLKIKGSVKDAFLGSDMMGNARLVVSDADFADIYDNGGLSCSTCFSVRTDHLEEFQQDYFDLGTTQVFSGNQSLIKTTYIMDLVIAGILLMVSFCLVIISGVMLKFIITFTVNEDYKEIGIMKAIGLNNSSIRKLYTVKYLTMAIIGAAIGFAAAVPFSSQMLAQVIQNMLIKNGTGNVWLQFVVSVVMACVITALAYHSTGKLKKLSPMDAIRSGNSGERFKRKGLLSLRKTHLNTTTFLACNDIYNELKRFIPLFCTGIVGIWLIAMSVNSLNTLSSDSVNKWFSMIVSDVWIADDEMMAECTLNGSDQKTEAMLDQIKDHLEDNGVDVDRVYLEVMFRYKVHKGDKSFSTIAFRGYHTSANEYAYEEGVPPKYANEIALSEVTAKNIDAQVGDTVTIPMDGEDRQFLVTALYQSMNNLGEGIRFSENCQMDYAAISGGFGVQIDFDHNLTEEQKKQEFEICKKLYTGVKTNSEYISDMLGGLEERMEALKFLILFIVVIIVVLVVVLMQKMFLIRERGEIAMLKSIGFTNRALIFWQTKRVAFVLLAGMIVGILTSTPFSTFTAGNIFKIMGASRIQFVIQPFEIYFLYPFLVFVSTILVCILVMLGIRKITIQDMNNIE